MSKKNDNEIEFLIKAFKAGDGNKKTFKKRLTHLYMTGNIEEKSYDEVCSYLNISSIAIKKKIVYNTSGSDASSCGSSSRRSSC